MDATDPTPSTTGRDFSLCLPVVLLVMRRSAMPDPHRTKDGFVRAEHLRRGAIDQLGWRVGNDWHIVRLQLRRRSPEMWEVTHRIIHHHPGTNIASSTEEHTELFNSLTEARRYMRQVHREPPTSYAHRETA